MKFEELHELIPYAIKGKAKSLSMKPYPDITLKMPGRHADQTTPKGGDFVVCVTDPRMKWKAHQFNHDDIFNDLEVKTVKDNWHKMYYPDNHDEVIQEFMECYLKVITGTPPREVVFTTFDHLRGLSVGPFMRAVQCLAVAEHRRYPQYEEQFGGRFLPFRFAAGIAQGLWTAEQASEKQKYGRPAVEQMEKKYGTPVLTEELMK